MKEAPLGTLHKEKEGKTLGHKRDEKRLKSGFYGLLLTSDGSFLMIVHSVDWAHDQRYLF